MKKLLLILFLLIFVMPIVLVGLVIALISDRGAINDVPVHLYVEDSDAMAMLYESLDDAITAMRAEDDADFELDITEDMVNTLIFNAIRGIGDEEGVNPAYTGPVDGCAPEACYVTSEAVEVGDSTLHLRVTGIWMTFEDDRFSGNVGFEMQWNEGFTYRTTVRVRMSFVDDAESYTLQFDRLRLGHLPFPRWLLSPIAGAVASEAGDELEDEVPGIDLDIGNLKLTIDKRELTDALVEDEEEQAILQVFLDVFFDPEYEIVRFRLLDEVFRFTARLSLIRNPEETDVPDYLKDFDYETFEPEKQLRTIFEQAIFNMAFRDDPGDPASITIPERTLNRILFKSFDGFKEMSFEQTYERDGVEETLRIGLVGMWFEFHVSGAGATEERYMEIKALFDIAGVKSMLSIRADEVEDLTFDLVEIALGKDADPEKAYISITDLDAFKDMLKSLDDFPFGYIDEEGRIVLSTDTLTDLMEETSADIRVDAVYFVQGGIRIDIVAPEYQDILDAFSQAVKDVFGDAAVVDALDDWLVDHPEHSDVYDAAKGIHDKLDGGDNPDAEDVAALVEAYGDLPPEAQQSFFDVFSDLIDPAIFEDFDGVFGD